MVMNVVICMINGFIWYIGIDYEILLCLFCVINVIGFDISVINV